MSGRDRMLATIKNALGGGLKPARDFGPAAPSGAEAPRGLKSAPQFASALEALGGRVFETGSTIEARAKVDELLAGRSYTASAAPIVQACGFVADVTRESCASAEFGISSADFALADTGSLVFLSEPRLVSLLPPRHIVILEQSKILSGLDELFARVPYPAAHSSSMVIVTGPSRTADIEMRLVRGVHGPGDIAVIMINQM